METETFTVTVQDTGAAYPCRSDESLFEAMRRAGCGPVRCGCFGGGCGACKMRVVEGRIHLFKRQSAAHISAANERENIVLLCCAQPRGDVTIAGVNT